MPQLVSGFKQNYPNISITLSDTVTSIQITQLLSGALSIGFIRMPATTELTAIPVMSDRLILAVNSQLHGDKSVASLFASMPYLQLTSKNCPRSLLHQHIARSSRTV